MGERKQGSSEAAKRAKPGSGRRAAPKIVAKKEKKATAAKKSPSETPTPGSETARDGKDAETLPMVDGPMAEETSKIMADPNENRAERRTAGGTDSARHVEGWPSANQATAKPETRVNQGGRGESKPVSRAARKPATDKRVKPGDSGESTPRPNTLVPTNGIHATERRYKRRLPQNRTVMFLVGATLLGILFIGEQTEPPDMTSVEARIAAGQTGRARAQAGAETGNPISEAPPGAQAWDLDGEELVEMERLLARLDLAPSTADGIVDQQTRHAIRLYQQIAGLPVDGEPSPALLTDMREVVRILDGGDG